MFRKLWMRLTATEDAPSVTGTEDPHISQSGISLISQTVHQPGKFVSLVPFLLQLISHTCKRIVFVRTHQLSWEHLHLTTLLSPTFPECPHQRATVGKFKGI